MRRSTSDGIFMWFWGRDDPNVPDDVADEERVIDTSTWGEPEGVWAASGCNVGQHFDAHEIVFDLTFCVSTSSLALRYAMWSWASLIEKLPCRVISRVRIMDRVDVQGTVQIVSLVFQRRRLEWMANM